MPVDKKITALVIFGILIGIIAWFLPIQEDIAFEYIVNNTDLYNNGRLQDVTYTANDSAIQLFLIFHALGTGSPIVIDTNLSINGTVVEDRDFRTSAGAGLHEHFSMTAHIPKGANYSVTNSSNLETMEWREYPILTGRNGTLSINMTGGAGTGSQNLSQVLAQGPDAQFQGIVDLSDIRTDGQFLIESANGGVNTSYMILDYGTESIQLNAKHNNAYQNIIDMSANETTFHRNVTMDNSKTNYTNSGKYLDVGYSASENRMIFAASPTLYLKQAGTYLGYMGSGYLLAAYDNKPIRFGVTGDNYSQITYNTTHGTTFSGNAGTNQANRLNITGFDKVNMYQGLDLNNNSIENINYLNTTGLINTTLTNKSYNSFRMLGSTTSDPFYTAYENSTMRIEMALGGTQIWRFRNTDSTKTEIGYITYATPGGNPGIAIFNSTLLNRIDIASTNNGFEFYVYPNASSVRPSSPALVINRTQNIVIPAMAGAGNAYTCVDSNGALYRGGPGC